MSVIETTCPNRPKLGTRYGKKIAQVHNALIPPDLVCMGCGHDHDTGRTPKEIAADIRQHLLAQGVNLK